MSEATATERVRLARWRAGATVAFGLLFYTLGAAIKPGYSSVSQYISELNANGTAWASQLGLFGFVPLGLLFASFLVAGRSVANVRGASRFGWWLLWSQPIAFVGAAVAPCDAGCPVGGSASQVAHDLLGVTTYFAGALALVLLALAPVPARAARVYLAFAGVCFLLIFVAMLVPELSLVRGLVQRIADGLLGIAVLVIAWYIVGVPRE